MFYLKHAYRKTQDKNVFTHQTEKLIYFNLTVVLFSFKHYTEMYFLYFALPINTNTILYFSDFSSC